ncbi:MAG: hypothetical protein WA824_08235 [Candidatus Sulfotelmatobacter sp.]
MCPACGAFIEPANIDNPDEYRDLIRKMIEQVNQGALRMTKGSCPLDRVLEDPFPDDVLFHNFYCVACRCAFTLHADTYHGNVRWMQPFC